MKISDIYNKKKSLSFEIFPPKKDSELENIDETLKVLCEPVSYTHLDVYKRQGIYTR